MLRLLSYVRHFKLKCNLTCAWSKFCLNFLGPVRSKNIVVTIFSEEIITFMAEVIMLIPMIMNFLHFCITVSGNSL